MDGFQVVVGSVTSLLLYGLLIAGVYKAFQVHAELGEIKELLRDIRRNTEAHPSGAPALAPASPEDLIRAIHRQGAAEAVLSEHS